MESDSAENQVSHDGVKEILAPAEGPRENLINTAVKFLQNPKVMTSPLYQKRAFLEKKGLTQVEIDLAVQRAGVTETTAPAPGHPSGQPNGQPGQVGPPQVYSPNMAAQGMMQPHYVPIPPQSGWARVRDLTLTTAVVASVSYAVYQLFQTYLRPWLLGKTEQEKRLERLEQEIKAVQDSVQDSLSQISRTLTAIQASLAEQQQQTLASHGEVRGITDLKAEISSLKGLMLNKNQFPSLPTPTPILPSWQRAPATTAATSASSSSSPSSSKPSVSTTAESATVNSAAQNKTTSEPVVEISTPSEKEEEAESQSNKNENLSSQEELESGPLLAAEDDIKSGTDNPKSAQLMENGAVDATINQES